MLMWLVRAVRMEVVDLIMAVVVVTEEGEAAMVVAVEGVVELVRERPRPESVLYIYVRMHFVIHVSADHVISCYIQVRI